MARRKQQPAPEILAEPIPEDQPSPVDNLPVAAGKRRRGRPRRIREAEAVEGVASSAPGDGPPAAPASDLRAVVRESVEQALKKSKPAGPETRQGIVGLVRQVTRQEVSKAVRSELGSRDSSAGLQSEVREVVTEHDLGDALATQHGQGHPFWHLLRNR